MPNGVTDEYMAYTSPRQAFNFICGPYIIWRIIIPIISEELTLDSLSLIEKWTK